MHVLFIRPTCTVRRFVYEGPTRPRTKVFVRAPPAHDKGVCCHAQVGPGVTACRCISFSRFSCVNSSSLQSDRLGGDNRHIAQGGGDIGC